MLVMLGKTMKHRSFLFQIDKIVEAKQGSKGQGFEQCKCNQYSVAKVQGLALVRRDGKGQEGN